MNKEKIEFKFFDSDENIESFISFAKELWQETYFPILDNEAVMIYFNKVFTLDKIKQELENPSIYWIKILANDKLIGYINLHLQEESIFISKFYLTKENRNKGIFKFGLSLFEKIALKNRKISLRLNINSKNRTALTVYEKTGFKKVKELNLPVGKVIMNEIIMEKDLLCLYP